MGRGPEQAEIDLLFLEFDFDLGPVGVVSLFERAESEEEVFSARLGRLPFQTRVRLSVSPFRFTVFVS